MASDSPTKMLRHRSSILVVGIVSGIIAPAVLLFVLLQVGLISNADLAILLMMLIFFILAGWMMILEYLMFRVFLSKDSVGVRNLLGKDKFIQWDDIHHISYSRIWGWVVLKGGENVVIRVSILVKDFQLFLESLEQFLPKDLYNDLIG